MTGKNLRNICISLTKGNKMSKHRVTIEAWEMGGFKCDGFLEVTYRTQPYTVAVFFGEEEIIIETQPKSTSKPHFQNRIMNYVLNHFYDLLHVMYDLHVDDFDDRVKKYNMVKVSKNAYKMPPKIKEIKNV